MDEVARKFASLSIKDLLDAREAYHVHLAHLEGVYATAVGRYLLRAGEGAKDTKDTDKKRDLGPRRATSGRRTSPTTSPTWTSPARTDVRCSTSASRRKA